MFQKKIVFPNSQQSKWVVFSMLSVNDITDKLNQFPKVGAETGCSTSLVWSGDSGFNTPSTVYSGATIGVVLDPTCLDVQQADLLAYGSGKRLAEEEEKPIRKDHKSKYNPNTKMGYSRSTPDGDRIFTTNLAKHEITSEDENEKKSIYHSVGSLDRFANNVYRKYNRDHKNAKYVEPSSADAGHKIVPYNEALAFQKEDTNPIKGILITTKPTSEQAIALNKLLEEHSSLDLYLYNPKAKNDIVRVIKSDAAKDFLKDAIDNKGSSFNELFESATPFKGFDIEDNVLSNK